MLLWIRSGALICLFCLFLENFVWCVLCFVLSILRIINLWVLISFLFYYLFWFLYCECNIYSSFRLARRLRVIVSSLARLLLVCVLCLCIVLVFWIVFVWFFCFYYCVLVVWWVWCVWWWIVWVFIRVLWWVIFLKNLLDFLWDLLCVVWCSVCDVVWVIVGICLCGVCLCGVCVCVGLWSVEDIWNLKLSWFGIWWWIWWWWWWWWVRFLVWCLVVLGLCLLFCVVLDGSEDGFMWKGIVVLIGWVWGASSRFWWCDREMVVWCGVCCCGFVVNVICFVVMMYVLWNCVKSDVIEMGVRRRGGWFALFVRYLFFFGFGGSRRVLWIMIEN